MTTENDALDISIAKAVFGRECILMDTLGLGTLSVYVVDSSASRNGGTTTATLLGGSWTKGRTASGDIVEVYCVHCPAYSRSIHDAWELLTVLRRSWEWGNDSRHLWPAIQERLESVALWGALWGIPAGEAATAICKEVLAAAEATITIASVQVDVEADAVIEAEINGGRVFPSPSLTVTT